MPDPREDRIQPCLFDRLIDENPGTKLDSRSERIISLQRYREGVLRDLSLLLNAKSRDQDDEIAEFADVAASGLNFGIPDVCGKLSVSLDLTEVERQISQAIQRFEPRIIPKTLKVRAISAPGLSANVLTFEIRGDLWASPMPEQLFLRTEIDLETGESTLK